MGVFPVAMDEVIQFLESGRHALREAPAQFGRPLGPEDYWWLAVGLAACVVADVQQRPHVGGRLAALVEALGREGPVPGTVEALLWELAILDSEGLVWPLYERVQGQWRRTGVQVAERFGAEEAWWLAVAHIACALLVQAGRAGEVPALAEAIGDLVAEGLAPEHEAAILQVFRELGQPGEGGQEP